MRRALGIVVTVLALLAGPGCGVIADPTIADEVHERLAPAPKGFRNRPCRGRDAKVAALSELVWLGQDLRARVREFDTLPPPQLHDRMMAAPLLGHGDDYRCIVQDFVRIDLRREPDFLDALPLVANLYVLEARVLMGEGRPVDGWAHVLDGLALHAEPSGFGVEQYLSLLDVLRAIPPLLEQHPPDAATTVRLVDAIEATRIDTTTICGGLRHELLLLGVTTVRAHLGQRERELMAKRFGLDAAMRTWRSPWPGTLGRAEWQQIRQTHDAMMDGCRTRPLGHALQRAAAPMLMLDAINPPTAVRLRMIADRLNRMGVLIDTQITVLATLRALRLRHELGRLPTTAELAVSFGRRPKNPWDNRHYTFAVGADAAGGGVLTVARGPYRHEVALPSG